MADYFSIIPGLAPEPLLLIHLLPVLRKVWPRPFDFPSITLSRCEAFRLVSCVFFINQVLYDNYIRRTIYNPISSRKGLVRKLCKYLSCPTFVHYFLF